MRRKHAPGCPCCSPVIACPTTLTVRVRSSCSTGVSVGAVVTVKDQAGVYPDAVAVSTAPHGFASVVLDGAGTFDVHVDNGPCGEIVIEDVELLACERKTLPDVGGLCCLPGLFTTLTTPWGVLDEFTRSEFTPPFPGNTRTELWFPGPFAVCSGYGPGGGAFVNFQTVCVSDLVSPPTWRMYLRAMTCFDFDLTLPARAAPGLGQFGQPSGITPGVPPFAEATIADGTCDPLNLTFEISEIHNALAAADFGVELGDELVWTP